MIVHIRAEQYEENLRLHRLISDDDETLRYYGDLFRA